MDRSLVMTVIGPDRPGLVDSLATVIHQHGGNWLESRLCHLGGQFAGVLRVQIAEENETGLLHELTQLGTQGLQVMTQSEPTPPDREITGDVLATLELVGQDRPGIVNEITRALAGRTVNVEELETQCVSAPMSAEPLFQARAKLRIPANCNRTALKQDLEKIAADLMVDITFEPSLT
jgi:glycine cleavage system regulatory protein